MNQYYSLANRFFDYIMAGIPQICVAYPEYKNINHEFEVAMLVENIDVKTLSNAIHQLLNDDELYKRLQQNTITSSRELKLANRRKKTYTILEKHLHIICFNVPFPVDYGGVVDLFWKLPYLQKLGIRIHLHCFDYGRGEQQILNQYCSEVFYYKRGKGIQYLFNSLPYIVSTRDNEKLKFSLLQDYYPILCEGLHSSSIITDNRFKERKIFVRLHNVEHEYYQYLKESTTSLLKKIYYWRESILLKKYENILAQSNRQLLALSELDLFKFKDQFNANRIDYLPMFIPDNWNLNSKVGKGNYCLYQGDLSVAPNQKAVIWLIDNVINKLVNIQFVIAGKNPNKEIQDKIRAVSNVRAHCKSN